MPHEQEIQEQLDALTQQWYQEYDRMQSARDNDAFERAQRQ
jgi:hypothetical protein